MLHTPAGMGATVMDGAVVKKGAMVAAGALVAPGTVVPTGQIFAGNPARLLRAMTESEISFSAKSAENYAELALARCLTRCSLALDAAAGVSLFPCGWHKPVWVMRSKLGSACAVMRPISGRCVSAGPRDGVRQVVGGGGCRH